MNLNLANKVTLSRILMVPIFMVILFLKPILYREYLAAVVFIIAASTDGLDGYLARSRKQVTKLGKFLDPLADKLLVSAALISLVELGKIDAWVAFIIIGREFTINGLRSIVAADGHVIAASKLGKVKTVFQILAIVFILLDDFPFSFLGIFGIGKAVLYLALFFTLYSGVDYLVKARKVLQI